MMDSLEIIPSCDQFLHFRAQVISYPGSLRAQSSHFIPRSFVIDFFLSKQDMHWVGYEMTFLC